jgi:Domain of Unknown Function (DUF1080)
MKSKILAALIASTSFVQTAEPGVPQARVALYDGRGFDHWLLVSRDGKPETAANVFSPGDNSEIHVYKNYPDGYQIDGKANDTHALMVSRKSYSRYSFKFDYKWGTKKLNNFGQWQYDAGFYYHMQDQKVWPASLEFQIRYDHLKRKNHTGDLWNLGVNFSWEKGPDGCYIAPGQGGTLVKDKKWEHPAWASAEVHALDGQWNQCEVIVMGGDYAIHKVNGRVVNYATFLSKDSGPIALQAETAEIFYRNITICEFPAALPAGQFLN